MKLRVSTIVIFLLAFTACRPDDDGGSIREDNKNVPTPYQLVIPPLFNFISTPIIPEDNPLTVEGIALGKKLFFEKKLSRDNSISCGTCHNPANAFNDKGQVFSEGVDGTLGIRNAMPLFNLAWVSVTSRRFNWHGSASTLEEQAFGPVRDPKEMKENWPNVEQKLQNDASYPPLFEAAFQTPIIDSTLVVKAIAQFERTLISGETRADKYMLEEFAAIDQPGDNFLSAQEEWGFELFQEETKGDCFHCHGNPFQPLWTNNKYVNNGLDAQPDSGLAEITKDPNDIGKFKTPSLRNLVFTAPYMHDGRFQTLGEVIDFYDDGVQNSPTIDGNQKPRDLNVAEKAALIAFLRALTDSSFVTNPDFQP